MSKDPQMAYLLLSRYHCLGRITQLGVLRIKVWLCPYVHVVPFLDQHGGQDGGRDSEQDGKWDGKQDGKRDGKQDGKQNGKQDGKQDHKLDGKLDGEQDGEWCHPRKTERNKEKI